VLAPSGAVQVFCEAAAYESDTKLVLHVSRHAGCGMPSDVARGVYMPLPTRFKALFAKSQRGALGKSELICLVNEPVGFC
jgi:hypothetical protein